MLVTYFDEVKYHQGKQPFYWLAGICATAEEIFRIERSLTEIATEFFGESTLSRANEFHAADLFNRAAHFKTWTDVGRRVLLLHRLIEVLDSEPGLGKIHVQIDVEKMVASDHESKAFMFFAEKVDDFLKGRKLPGLLIGDRESSQTSDAFVRAFSTYRGSGTSYYFGKKLEYLIDTVHFTDSHHSRMLQMADLYAWILQLGAKPAGNALRDALVKHVRETTKIYWPSRYKQWPTQDSWIKR